MDRKSFVLVHQLARQRAIDFVAQAPHGYVVVVTEPTKRRVQEEKYHAQIGDIAEQTTYAGREWDKDDMKRLLIDEFAQAMRDHGTPLRHDSRLVPSADGKRIIQLGVQSRQFSIKEASNFIEFLYAYGADRSVVWSGASSEGP